MASIGRIAASALTGSFEQTVALANLNFDFTLIKVDAPHEFAGVGSQLSSNRRNDAETGSSHVLARKLGALFRDIIPPTPELVKAYGTRASAIFDTTTAHTKESPMYGVFATTVGADGKSMWAAATSGKHAIACHLLACLLARMWDAPEATSYWMELITRRKQKVTSESEYIGDPALMVASQESFQRQHLADWDASARAWLRIADSAMARKQTQLHLIMDNISLPVNYKADTYESIIEAWKLSLQQMERLLTGYPQEARDGAILLGLCAWHLYPDMIVLGSEEKEVKQNDSLFQGRGILTVGLVGDSAPGHEGIYWSLPLRHLRHYGLPVTRKRLLNTGEGTRISIDQLCTVLTAAYLREWDDRTLPTDSVVAFFAEISRHINVEFESMLPEPTNGKAVSKDKMWLDVLAERARAYVSATGPEKNVLQKLWKMGQAHSPMFRNTEPFSNLFTVSSFLRTARDMEKKIEFLREIARSSGATRSSDFLIRYQYRYQPTVFELFEYATAYPQIKRMLTGEEKQGHGRWIHFPDAEVEEEHNEDEEMSSYFDDSFLTVENPWAEHFAATPSKDTKKKEERKTSSSTKNTMKDTFHEALQDRKRQILLMGESIESKSIFVATENEFSAEVLTESLHSSNVTVYVSVIGDKTCQLLRRFEKLVRHQDNDTFKQEVDYEAGIFESKFKLTTKLKQRMFNPNNVSFRGCAKIFVDELALGGKDLFVLRGIAAMANLYEGLNGATIDVRSVKFDLGRAGWVGQAVSRGERYRVHLSRVLAPTYLHYAASFACIAMLETGSFNLNPSELGSVMALSVADSLYVASCLLRDPSESSPRFYIQRLIGNVGRAGLAFLIPPVEPMIKDYDAVNEWQFLEYAEFDGRLQNNFSSTSLQLSFTEAIFPINIGYSGGVDIEAFFLETLVSVYDSGHWIADIDVLKALESTSVSRIHPCADVKSESSIPRFTSVDNFVEMLCEHENICIVRAWKNWQARLATASICFAKGYEVVVMNEPVCWRCIQIKVDRAQGDEPSKRVVVIS
ncbi:uncharacterized protein N7503_010399 [Penicillium pulvis]|uniref:uncharacterized protein n=1 Tax=Penicillium pulvis TaxID=1562058 RepID=UPI00254986CE|nr:uncharacterized protein N7503_010399 [Penicillium pulvis]KAJ5785187.1 hypothetical protein N7503_010399 [Penicillium pulvis]